MYNSNALLVVLALAITFTNAWDDSYIKIGPKAKRPENNVSEVTFRLYSTKFFLQNSDLYEDIEFDEESQTASLKEDTMYDKSLKSVIIAHGNGGGYKMDHDFWQHYSEVANETNAHYNIIGIRWGSGWTYKHAFVGIKAARVVQSLQENHQLDVTALHAIGWSYGADIVNALASEIVFSKMGKMGRLTLLDPGRRLETFNIAGNPVKQIGFYNKTFAAFVDVYHTSTVGVFDRPLGNADIWINGGQTQPNGIKPGSHQAAPTFYVKSIATPSGSCQFKAWHCEDSDWQPFHNDKRDKEDTCNYGKSEIKEPIVVGEYLKMDETNGNLLLFMTKDYEYCEDVACNTICH